MYKKAVLQTEKKGSLIEITDEVRNAAAESGIKEGVVTVTSLSSDCGIVITSFYDPKGHQDIIDDFERIFPPRLDYKSEKDPWENSGQSKASIAGQSADLILHGGEVVLGGSQGIFFAEYCDPKEREYSINVFG